MIAVQRGYAYLLMVMLGVFASPYFTGCESTFEPLQENGRYHFSIFGALDHSADTQWVRVMPIMDTVFVNSSEPIDAEVTMTRLSTGESSVLNDSLFRFSDRSIAWNFWTTTPVHADEEYMITAMASDGSSSRATVSIPPAFPEPEVNYSFNDEEGIVNISGVHQLVVADIIYTFTILTDAGETPNPIEINISHLDRLSHVSSSSYRFFPNDVGRIASEYGVTGERILIKKREVLVVSGSAEWPDFEELSEDEAFLPEINSNVEDGLGVLVGIVSKRLSLVP
ncbi:MAG: hypothetical protein WD059_05295 [Balneolaceae bacterium]